MSLEMGGTGMCAYTNGLIDSMKRCMFVLQLGFVLRRPDAAWVPFDG